MTNERRDDATVAADWPQCSLRRRRKGGKTLKAYRKNLSTILAFSLWAIAVPAANAQANFKLLHTFTGIPDGTNPNPLIRDTEGNLYGTALAGGDFGCGMVYKIDTAGDMTVLYNFACRANGSSPDAALTLDAAGNLYGTTEGDGFTGLSVLFKLTPDGKETSFPAPEGSLNSPVAVDAKGNMYGMSPYGGTPNCGWEFKGLGCGTLFLMKPNGQSTIVHNFTGTDGMYPWSGLVRDSQGNFYGAAVFGGIRTCRAYGNGLDNSPGCGTIFKVDTHGKFSVLHTFTGKSDGAGPLGVIIDSEDNLYGIATGGGNTEGAPLGYGTIFKFDTKTNAFSVLFIRPPTLSGSGAYFAALLARDSKGNLYGGDETGGGHGAGYVFRLDTQGRYTDVYDLDVLLDGKNQDGFFVNGLVLGPAHDIYGTSEMGGFSGFGTIFELTP
jgi:uncharacterized repeat protein (TIGR03803 family)